MCLQPDSTPALPDTSSTASEMTYIVSSGALNSTHSLSAINVGGSHNELIWTTPQCMPLQAGQHYVPDVGELQCLLIQMTVVLVYFDYCAVM